MDALQKIFGGADPDDHQQRYQNYQAGYSRGSYDDLDDDDVHERYQRTAQYAPPQVFEEAHAEAFERLPMQQRQQVVDQFRQVSNDPRQPFSYDQFTGTEQDYDPRQMAQMMGRARQQQPDLISQVMGPGGMLSNPLAKMALAGVTAAAAQKLMGRPGSGRGGLIN